MLDFYYNMKRNKRSLLIFLDNHFTVNGSFDHLNVYLKSSERADPQLRRQLVACLLTPS